MQSYNLFLASGSKKCLNHFFSESDCLPCGMGWKRECTPCTDEPRNAMRTRGRQGRRPRVLIALCISASCQLGIDQNREAKRDREGCCRPSSDGSEPPLEHGTRRRRAPSRKAPVDLGPHLGGIVVVGSIDLPSRAGRSLSLRSAPVNYGLMCLSQPRIGSPMHGHRHLPGW